MNSFKGMRFAADIIITATNEDILHKDVRRSGSGMDAPSLAPSPRP